MGLANLICLIAFVFLMPSALLFEISADANFDEICVKSKDKFPDLDEEANSTLKDTSLHCV